MRSDSPLVGNPWPHEMVISVDDHAYQLLELLWVREAWGLEPVGDDLPPLLVDTPPAAGDPDDRDAWQAAWPQVWDAAVNHAAGPVEPQRFDELRRARDGSPERAELLRKLHGPTWRQRFGDAAFGESYHVWSAERVRALIGKLPRSVAESPERRSLDALIPAWRAGLSKVITIPCRGDHLRILGDSVMLTTEDTRDDPDRYAHALTAFARK